MAAEIAIDFGTSKTILLSGSKILLEEPTVASVDTETWEPVCFGRRAYDMIGRTPESITTVFPIERGVISDYKIAEAMLKSYMKKALGRRILKPKLIVSVPIAVTTLQHRSVANAAHAAGGRKVCTVEAPVAAAIGLGVDFEKPDGAMVVDIGAGTTDVAVISMGGLSESSALPAASMDFDTAIAKYVKRKYNILIGNLTAESIKKQIGCVVKRPVTLVMNAKGVDMVSSLPRTFEISSTDVYQATVDVADTICSGIRQVAENTAPDLLSDIMTSGIYLTGGGSQIYGMDELIAESVGIKVNKCSDPGHTVVKGARTVIKNPEIIKNGDYQFRSIEELIVD